MSLARSAIVGCVFAVSYFMAGSHAVKEDVQDPILSSYYVEPDSEITMLQIADRFEVVRREGPGFRVIVPEQRADELLGLAPKSLLIEQDIRQELFEKMDAQGKIAGYRTFDEVAAYLEDLQARFPELVQLETYGHSQNGRPLYALKISDNVTLDEDDEPNLMLTAATHGDELITVEVLLGLIDQLLAGHGSDERLERFVNGAQLYFLPVINPDGFVRRSRYANGVDPNRDYPWPDQPDRRSVACIEQLINFFHDHNFDGTMDFHAYGEMIMYPWAYTYNRIESEDESMLDAVTTAMAETNGYAHGPIAEVIYIARGSSADYYYWKNRSAAIAIELGRSKVPPSNQIPRMIDENAESTWRWMDALVPDTDAAH